MAQIERAALKFAAKSQLKGNLGFLLIAFILYFVIVGITSCTVVGPVVLAGPFEVGLAGICLAFVRGSEKPSINNLFDGFRQFLGAFVAYLLTVIFTILWALLLIVPGIIAAIRYSQVFYILKDNPELDGLEAINKSKQMMNGHKGEYFVLLLSFFWWFLLGCITLGIAFVWIGPYISLTLANYYEELKKQRGEDSH
jgi:uncharacterized membrane protein